MEGEKSKMIFAIGDIFQQERFPAEIKREAKNFRIYRLFGLTRGCTVCLYSAHVTAQSEHPTVSILVAIGFHLTE